MKFYRKDWVLFHEIANEGGKVPKELLDIEIKTANPDENKHIPYIEELEDGYFVKAGKTGYHSTDAEHHTIFIDLMVDDKYYYRQYIARDAKPEAKFNIPKGKKVTAYAFCNLHGMWSYSL